jgi:lipid-binding SYLF domain-containing protein
LGRFSLEHGCASGGVAGRTRRELDETVQLIEQSGRRALTLTCDVTLSWSRSQGLFAGLALEGATLRQVSTTTRRSMYGKKLENRDIVTKGVRAPQAAGKLMALLNRYSAKERTS